MGLMIVRTCRPAAAATRLISAVCAGRLSSAFAIWLPEGLVMNTMSECLAAWAMPSAEPVAFTSTGRPYKGFGVTKAPSIDQYGPSTVMFSVADQSCFSRPVNTSAIS